VGLVLVVLVAGCAPRSTGSLYLLAA